MNYEFFQKVIVDVNKAMKNMVVKRLLDQKEFLLKFGSVWVL